VSLASLLAGFVDSIVGGGGLILVPALFATFPTTHNRRHCSEPTKVRRCGALAFATVQYSRRVNLPWPAHWGLRQLACFAASHGAAPGWLPWCHPNTCARVCCLVVGLMVLAYTLAKKQLGRLHAPRFTGSRETLVASAIGAIIGFYDGFFGPGTGSFFVFLLVRLMGYDFLHASAGAKLLNTASNLAAIGLFALKGHVWWHFVLAMAIANVLGSLAGTHLALKHGTGFVRGVFILVVSALILKTGYDAFLR
jgi:uncharacterized membrane protein YfcA